MGRERSPKDHRFPRRVRLTRAAEYGRVFSAAERIADRYFTVLITPNAVAHPRLGLAVSRRVAPRAVVRNRIKRVIRETFRHHQRQLGAIDAVVIARQPARAAPKPLLSRALTDLWQRVAKRCEQY